MEVPTHLSLAALAVEVVVVNFEVDPPRVLPRLPALPEQRVQLCKIHLLRRRRRRRHDCRPCACACAW